MARIKAILNAFTGGEVSPEVWGRTDTDQYPTMVEEMRNVISNPRGGAQRRDGLHYVVPTKFPQRNSRLIPFVFSREQSYIMEMGDGYIRFFRDSGYVEDIGNIVTYLGDGTSIRFIYPYPLVDQADIEVYDENGNLVPDTEYTITTIDNNFNYAVSFDNAGWNKDYNSTGAPWTVNLTAATNPGNQQTQLGYDNAQFPVGAAYLYTVDMTSFSYTSTTQTLSNNSDIPLINGGEYVTVVNLLSDYDVLGGSVNVNYDVSFVDTSGAQTSDFFWEVRFKGEIIAEGTQLAVGNVPFRLQGTVVYNGDVYLGDAFSLHVRAIYNQALQSAPEVAGGTTPSSLSISFVTNRGAQLQSAIVPFGDSVIWRGYDPAVGTITLIDQVETSYYPSPMKLLFRAQDGLVCTIDNPVINIKTEGYIVTFNTAPPQGGIRLIADGSSLPEAVTNNINSNNAGAYGNSNGNGAIQEVIHQSGLYDSAVPVSPDDIYEIQSPFFESELEELHYAQANDVMIFASDTQKPWRLTRYGAYDWRWDQPVMRGSPWEGESSNYTGDGSKTVFSYDFASSTSADVKVYLNGELQTSGYTIDHGNKTVTFGTAPKDGQLILIQGPNTYNELAGYPRTVAFFQERLYFGGTVANPQTLWGSRAADFYEFTVPDTEAEGAPVLAPDDPVEYTIAAYTHEAIEWLSSERVLVIGTSATEHRLAPDQYIATDRLPTVSRMSAYGGAHVMPAFMGNTTVFVHTAGNQVRTYEQTTQSVIEKWDSIELDWMASHLTKDKVKQIGYALNPNSILYMVTLAGDFLTMTYEPGMGETNQIGWGKHTTDGKFKSCAHIPEDDFDQVWAIVERTLDDGEAYRYVEFFDPEVHTDATLTYPPDDGNPYPPLQAIGGLGHLEGKVVTIVADGSTHPEQTVTDGKIELNAEYENIEVGLKYIPRLKLQRFALAQEPGHLQGDKGRWVEVFLRMVDSAYPLVDGIRAAERLPNTPMNEVEPRVTGEVKVYHLGFDRNKQLVIEQDLPLPMHITAIYGVFEVHQG